MMACVGDVFVDLSVMFVNQSQPVLQISGISVSFSPSRIVRQISGSASVFLLCFSRKCSVRQSWPNFAHKVPLEFITTGAPWQLLPPSPLPKDEGELLQSIELVDDGDPDPKQGVSGHVPLDDVDRFELFLSSKLTITELFAGIFSVFMSSWLLLCR